MGTGWFLQLCDSFFIGNTMISVDQVLNALDYLKINIDLNEQKQKKKTDIGILNNHKSVLQKHK